MEVAMEDDDANSANPAGPAPTAVELSLLQAFASSTLPGQVDLPIDASWRDLDDVYRTNMNRKAKTHSSRDYKFVILPQRAEAASDAGSAKKTKKTKANKGHSRKDIIYGNFASKWESFVPKVKGVGEDYALFVKLQAKIYSELHLQPKHVALATESCAEVLGDHLVAAERRFAQKLCMSTGHEQVCYKIARLLFPELLCTIVSRFAPQLFLQLFRELSLATSPITGSMDVAKQVASMRAETVDRGLGLQPDSRCVKFSPTALQRRIMDHVDAGHSVLVSSPASSGKTMLSTYLAQKTKAAGKVTVYVGPNKPVCNEFALFVYNATSKTLPLEHAIGTEDFFSWDQICEGDVVICTPEVCCQLFLYGAADWVKRIGAVIFDELPDLVFNNRSHMAIVMMTCAVRGWQCMALSATMSNQVVEFARPLLGRGRHVEYIRQESAIRPTDLVIRDGSSLDTVHTSSTYTADLVSGTDALDTALRVPATVSEFKTVYDNAASRVQPVPTLPTSSPIGGVDMTRFVLECKRRELLSEPNPGQSASRVGLEACWTAEALYQFLKTAVAKQLLPVMIIHLDRDLLDELHLGLTALLDKDYPVREEVVVTEVLDGEDNHSAKPQKTVVNRRPNTPFGRFGVDEMAPIFRHRSHNGHIKFGYRGRRVLESEYYPGIEMGVGIHHHDVASAVRDAVESGLRLGEIKVVLCDNTMAIGLNMPIKTVCFLEDLSHSGAVVQAVGRAGRWGKDSCGNIVFFNCGSGHSKGAALLWDRFRDVKEGFPITLSHTLAMTAATPAFRKRVTSMLDIDIPCFRWNRNTATVEIAGRVAAMRSVGLLSATDFSLTEGGKIAMSLLSEGDVCLFAGWVLHSMRAAIEGAIQSPYDFLFVVSHFLRGIRTRSVLGYPSLAEVDKPLWSATVADAMATAFRACAALPPMPLLFDQFRLIQTAIPTAAITSLYVHFAFPTVNAVSTSKSLKWAMLGHFSKKISALQKVAKLKYGDEALGMLEKYLK